MTEHEYLDVQRFYLELILLLYFYTSANNLH